MSLLINSRESTREEKLANTVKGVRQQITSAFNVLRYCISGNFTTILNNPEFTAQEVLAELGLEDATTMLAVFTQVQPILKLVDPTYEITSIPDEVVALLQNNQ